jgi:protoporphyrin/coproporphyrin ferrochelatase
MMKPKTAVLMMAYGGPDSLADVKPYLLDVRGGRATPDELIEEVRNRYAEIGGKSPLLEITCRQAKALEDALNESDEDRFKVYVGMRHWRPYIRETVACIAQDGITDLVAICMTPFFSKMSTGAYYEHLDRAIESQENQSEWKQQLSVRKIGAWYGHPTYIQAVAANVTATLMDRQDVVVLFTAHSLPAALSEQGDPYARQFAHLAGLVAEAAGLEDSQWQMCFQSAGAQNTRWLGPSLEETIRQISIEGKKSILVAPIGFLSDHVEVLYDIDIEARHIATAEGVELRRIPSLNDQPRFIQALSEIIQQGEISI